MRATKDDVMAVYDLLRPYFEESALMLKATFSPENAIKTVMGWLSDDMYYCYLTEDGFFALAINEVFTVEPESMVEMFYVSPEGRGMGAGRKLLSAIDAINKERGVVNCYAVSQSAFQDGGKNAKLFTNLFKKFGFCVIGDSLVREY